MPQPGLPTEEARSRHAAWLAASQALRQDPSLVVYYPFQAEPSQDRTLRDEARGRQKPHDGSIVGCSWVTGRWQEKQGLEFKQPNDRVRVHVPGKFDSVTLVAWVRVDALPNVNHSLLLADGWPVGALHWQIGDKQTDERRKLVLAVKVPPAPAKPARGVESILGKLGLGVKVPAPKVPPGNEEGHYHAIAVFAPERLGKWVQLAAVYDRDRRQVTHYVDGRPAARVPIRVNVPLRVGDAEIGNWNGTYQPDAVRNFVGGMDEFLLFSRPLDDQEIARLYAEGRPPS